MFRSLSALVACTLLTSCVATTAVNEPAAAPPPMQAAAPAVLTTEAAADEVRAASEQYWRTRDQRDAAALAAQFTDNGMLMLPGIADATGRTAIRELYEKRLAAFKVIDFKVERREIQVAGNSAYELAWYGETMVTMDGSTRMTGRYLIVWQREPDGVWRVYRHLANFSGSTPIQDVAE